VSPQGKCPGAASEMTVRAPGVEKKKKNGKGAQEGMKLKKRLEPTGKVKASEPLEGQGARQLFPRGPVEAEKRHRTRRGQKKNFKKKHPLNLTRKDA